MARSQGVRITTDPQLKSAITNTGPPATATRAGAHERSRASGRAEASMRVVPKHHAWVRIAHWANVPLLLGLTASGLAIYWAAPVFLHAPDPATGSRDYLRDAGIAAARFFHDGDGDPRAWAYRHVSLGPQALAESLRLHWALAYLFMLNGALYVAGLIAGGGWRALLPRASDVADAFAMMRFYAGSFRWRCCASPGRTRRCDPSTTRSSAARTSPCRCWARWRCCRAGRCTSPSSSTGWGACS
jgi:hypothetical protein